MISSLKLEAGKRYRTREGDLVGPMKRIGHSGFCADDSPGQPCWFEHGRRFFNSEDPTDLVEEVRDEPAADPVNRPSHYTQGGVECIDAIKAAMSGDEFRGFLRGNVIKYLWRCKLKGGAESLAKAQWYLARLQSEIA